MSSVRQIPQLLYALLFLSAMPGATAAGPFDNAELRFYGHFTPSMLSYDDGGETYNRLVDNSYSGGRIGLWLDFDTDRGRTRFNFESSLGTRTSASVSQTYVPPMIDFDASSLRKAEVIRDTQRFGSFSFGQGSMASDGITESDLSGTQLAAYVGIADSAGGYAFRTNLGTLSNVTIADAFPTFDGGRAPRLRWDSPDLNLRSLGSLHIAVAAGVEVTNGTLVVNDSRADVGLFYRNEFGPIDFKSSLGVSIAEDNGESLLQTAGSLSIRHKPSGLSASFAAGTRDSRGQYLYSKIAIKRRWLPYGDTAVSFDYYNGANTVSASSRSESFGIGIVQDLDRQNLQLFLGLRQYEFDQPGIQSYRSSHSLIFGTKWVFRRLNDFQFRGGRSEVDWSEGD